MSDELESLELKISRFLRVGVLLAGLLMLAGWTLELLHQGAGDPFSSFKNYEEIPLKMRLQEIWTQGSWGAGLSYFGLFVLISLPVTRVALTAILFLKQKERILAAIALLVLCGLLFSFTQGMDL